MGPKRRNQFASKHVRLTAEQGFPEPVNDEYIVKLVKSRGGNTMECEDCHGSRLLCWLPNKFSKVVWAQRGDYLIVAPGSEEAATGKVSATIVHILFPEQVDHLRTLDCWPASFGASEGKRPDNEEGSNPASRSKQDSKEETQGSDDDLQCDSGDDADLFVNPNHMGNDSYDEEESDDEDNG